jgi:hypothetical protein
MSPSLWGFRATTGDKQALQSTASEMIDFIDVATRRPAFQLWLAEIDPYA